MGIKRRSRVCVVMRSRGKSSKMSKIGTSTNGEALCALHPHSGNYHSALTHFRKKPVKLFREQSQLFLKIFHRHRSRLSIGRCGASLTCSARAGLWASVGSTSRSAVLPISRAKNPEPILIANYVTSGREGPRRRFDDYGCRCVRNATELVAEANLTRRPRE